MLLFSPRMNLTAGLLLLVATAFIAAPAPAADTEAEKVSTVMTVGEMCGGCVKKINERFAGVKGIADVKCDIERQMVTLVPEKGVGLSPRGVWIAMERIGKTPTKMVCPRGVFTSKPSE